MRSHDDVRARLIDGPTPESHLGWSLLLGTLVASPVLVSALSGRQDVPSALTLYLLAIVGAWFAVGVLGGALAMAAQRPAADETGPDHAVDADEEQERDQPDPVGESR